MKIEALEQLPAQRWNSMVKTLVTSVATTILCGIGGRGAGTGTEMKGAVKI